MKNRICAGLSIFTFWIASTATCAFVAQPAGAAPPATPTTAPAQTAATPPPATPLPDSAVRSVVMRDARSALKFVDQLKAISPTGIFGTGATVVATKPLLGDLSFVVSGNYILVAGDRARVDQHMADIRMMAYLFERPRAHLQLNARVVQLTGPANTDVIQMTETVKALVDAQRTEVVRAFADLQDYLVTRLKRRTGNDLKIYDEIDRLFPTLGGGDRPLTVQEILLLLMVDRALPELPAASANQTGGTDTDNALLDFQKRLSTALQDPHATDEQIAHDISGKLAAWQKAVTASRDWCLENLHAVDSHSGATTTDFINSLKDPRCPLPTWVALRTRRSLELTQRLYPGLVRKQAHDSLNELQRRFQSALDREHTISESIAAAEAPTAKDKSPQLPGSLRRRLFDLNSVANDLVSVPMALFQAVAAAADDSPAGIKQLIPMFHAYAEERAKVDRRLAIENTNAASEINYAKLQLLESGINQWLRRGSDALSRSLEQQFYNHYVDQLRMLANRQLNKLTSHDILSASSIENVPDVVQDVLLSDSSVNMFVSNSVSLQFEPDTVGSVSATVSASLPSKQKLLDRLNQAAQATAALGTLNTAAQAPAAAPAAGALAAVTPSSPLTQFTQQYGIDGMNIVQALMAGGQAVPVQSGINLIANPSIGFDTDSVTLTLSVTETLQPTAGDTITDHVTNHNINDATVNALAYEPTVLSTLTSNTSYSENTGGFPMLRQIPGLKNIIKDIPVAPFKEGKRVKGIYQSSLIILEPIVIPTIEDMVRYYGGLR